MRKTWIFSFRKSLRLFCHSSVPNNCMGAAMTSIKLIWKQTEVRRIQRSVILVLEKLRNAHHFHKWMIANSRHKYSDYVSRIYINNFQDKVVGRVKSITRPNVPIALDISRFQLDEINFLHKNQTNDIFSQEICWIANHSRNWMTDRQKWQTNIQRKKNVIREIVWHLSKCIMGEFLCLSSIWLNRIQFKIIEWEKRSIRFILYTAQTKKSDCFMVCHIEFGRKNM